ncbi:hypothetical protein Rhal01_00759 [Rubritalea halochordaticola]|uniref:SAM-dependent methyltransferase n=2 Tax=Rubritalea halochordaticola TaxID=714537 RepID=A0ABP9UZW5_9BACT
MNDSRDCAGPVGSYPYPHYGTEATPALHSLIQNEIRERGPISFARYMELALYHDSLGYYTRGKQNIGKEGDFITSVSIGKTFGAILAHRIYNYWTECGSPSSFHLVELAANDGQLALDILSELRDSFPELFASVRYHICEHLPVMAKLQAEKLQSFSQLLSHYNDPAELSEQARTGVVLSNELIDAMPVRLVRKYQAQWHELLVTNDEEGFAYTESAELDTELQQFTQKLPTELCEGYTTEYRPRLAEFCHSVASILETGLVITIDYGYSRSAYYDEHRNTGTLRTYFKHQAGEDPLIMPGRLDITAHVDFTQLALAFREAGLGITDFSPQASYLTRHGSSWLQGLEQLPWEKQQKFIRQFQTLTHPSMMGRQFLVLECKKGCPDVPRAIDLCEINTTSSS